MQHAPQWVHLPSMDSGAAAPALNLRSKLREITRMRLSALTHRTDLAMVMRYCLTYCSWPDKMVHAQGDKGISNTIVPRTMASTLREIKRIIGGGKS